MKNELDIQPEEFEAMRFNVYHLGPEVNIVEHFEQLRIIPEFNLSLPSNMSKNMTVRYIMFVYDKNSPFRKRVKDIVKRKHFAGVAAGFPTDDAGNIKMHYLKQVINTESPEVIQMTVEYVRLQSDHKFSHRIALEHLYYQRITQLFEDPDNKIKAEEFASINTQLEQIDDELFAGEVDKSFKKQVNDILRYKKLELRPEDIARLLSEGKMFSAKQYVS